MVTRPLRLTAAIVLACCLVVASASSVSAQKAAGGAGPLRGLNIAGLSTGSSAAAIGREISIARSLNAQVVRVEFSWSFFQPSGAGTESATAINAANALFAAAAAAHIKVIALVDDTPCWASSAPASLLGSCGKGGRGGAAEAWPPTQPLYLGSFMGWLAKQYGSQLTAIEVWNEPDQINQDYLAGPEKPKHYAEMLRVSYTAIKSVAPNVTVLAGSLVGSNGAFMEALYKQGVKGYYDAVAVHFYNLVLGSVRRFHEVQLANGDHTPLWLDEFGWSSCWPQRKIEQEQACVTQAAQAQNITNSFKELAKAPYVAALLTYGFKDRPGEEFGVLTAAGKRKPSFAALSRVLASPFGSPTPPTLKLRVKRGQVIASGSGPVGDYMKIEVFQNGLLRWRPFFTLNRFNTYSIPLPRQLGTRGLTVRVYQYWLGLHSDVQRSI